MASFQHGCPAVCVHMRTNVLWGVPPCACTCARSCSGAVWCAAVCVHMRTNVFWGGLRLVASFQHGYAAVRVHMRTCVFWGGLRMVFSFQHGCVAVRVHIRTRVLQRQLDAIILLVGCQTPGDPRARTHAHACMEQQLHATILLVGCRVPGDSRARTHAHGDSQPITANAHVAEESPPTRFCATVDPGGSAIAQDGVQ